MYKVKFYTGDYRERQNQANAEKASVYIEHHFNASSNPYANYSCVIVGSNASKTSIAMADRYSDLVYQVLNVPQWDYDNDASMDGVVVGGFNGRGDGNVKYTKMPAMLLEPCFASNPASAAIIVSEEGRQLLAEVLTKTIREFVPDGGLVAFSVGHKYKRSHPGDRGASVNCEDPDPSDELGHNEASYAEDVLGRAKIMLESDLSLSID